MKILIAKGIPQPIIKLAMHHIELYKQGLKVGKALKLRGCGYRAVRLKLHYRLLIVSCNKCEILHHEAYNKRIGR